MLRGNWRYVSAIAGLIFTILLGYTGSQLYQAAGQRNSNYNYQPASDPSVPVVMPTKSAAKAYQPNCNNPQTNSDADLCAQWAAVEQVSESNRIGSFNLRLALGSLWATIIATGLLIWNLVETRSTARRQLRAYVNVEEATFFNVRQGGKAGVHLKLRNSGQTPAYNLKSLSNVTIHTAGEIPTFNEPPFDEMGVIDLGAGGFTELNSESVELTTEHAKGIYSGELAIFAFGLVHYHDAFGKKRTTRIAFESTMPVNNGIFRPCKNGNIST